MENISEFTNADKQTAIAVWSIPYRNVTTCHKFSRV